MSRLYCARLRRRSTPQKPLSAQILVDVRPVNTITGPTHVRQFFLCFAVACRSLGYHASGALMVRPSIRATEISSFVKWTSATFSFGFISRIRVLCPSHLLEGVATQHGQATAKNAFSMALGNSIGRKKSCG